MLRGGGRRSARRLVGGELGAVLLAGVPLGILLAVGVALLLRAVALPPGIPFDPGWPPVLAALAAALVTVAVVLVVVRRATADPVLTMLRRGAVAAAPRRGVGTLTWIVLALAGAGVAALVSSDRPTPLSLATPTLLALAAGLVVAWLLAVGGHRAAARALAAGRVPRALAATGLARRPGAGVLVAILTVASAATLFGANAVAVGARERQARALVETGAGSALTLASRDLAGITDLVHGVEPSGGLATVVAITRPRDNDAAATLVVQPREFADVTSVLATDPIDVDRLAVPVTPVLTVSGSAFSVDVTTMLIARPAATALDPGTGTLPGAAGVRLAVDLVLGTPQGQLVERRLGVLPTFSARPDGRPGPVRVAGPTLCPGACRVHGVRLEVLGADPDVEVVGRVRLGAARIDARAIDLGDPAQWRVAGAAGPVDQANPPATLQPDREPLIAELTGAARVVRLDRTDIPTPVPAVRAGSASAVPGAGGPGDEIFEGSGLRGDRIAMQAVQHVDALPHLGERAVLVNREGLLRGGVRLDTLDRLEVWFAPDAAASGARDRVERELAARGVLVLDRREAAATRQRYDESGPAWGLVVALVVALACLLIAALAQVVVAATARASVRADLDDLALAGVSPGQLRGAVRREQWWLVVAGTVAGTAAGCLGAWLAMPLVPLFTHAPAAPAPDWTPAWAALAGGFAVVVPRCWPSGGWSRRGRARDSQTRPGRGVVPVRSVVRGLAGAPTGVGLPEGAGLPVEAGRRGSRLGGSRGRGRHDRADRGHAGPRARVPHGGPGRRRALRRRSGRRVRGGRRAFGTVGLGQVDTAVAARGLLRPTAGRIRVGGHDLAEAAPEELDELRARDVGVLLQGAGRNLLPYLTARGNLEFAQSAARERGLSVPSAMSLLELLGVADVAGLLPDRLSAGQVQLVAVAVALAAGPGLLLADEPTSGLAHAARDTVIEACLRVNREIGATIILVTHDPAVAERLPRTVTIRDGRVGSEGRGGEQYSVVSTDGSLPLPDPVLADLTAGTLVRVHRDGDRWVLIPEEGA